MRKLLFALILACPSTLFAQTSAPTTAVATPAQIQSDLSAALVGDWTGVLEYRDYSEPATSTKRVQLPTWLSITTTPSATTPGMTWRYIYDDGPTKVVTEADTVTFDTANSSYSEAANGKPAQVFKVTGYATLKSGRGQLILIGAATDNDKPAETRVTLTLRRNLLNILEETRPAGSTDPFAFRHQFTFTRSKSPSVTP